MKTMQQLVKINLEDVITHKNNSIFPGCVIITVCNDPNRTRVKARVKLLDDGRIVYLREPNVVTYVTEDKSKVKKAYAQGLLTGRNKPGVMFTRATTTRWTHYPRRYYVFTADEWQKIAKTVLHDLPWEGL